MSSTPLSFEAQEPFLVSTLNTSIFSDKNIANKFTNGTSVIPIEGNKIKVLKISEGRRNHREIFYPHENRPMIGTMSPRVIIIHCVEVREGHRNEKVWTRLLAWILESVKKADVWEFIEFQDFINFPEWKQTLNTLLQSILKRKDIIYQYETLNGVQIPKYVWISLKESPKEFTLPLFINLDEAEQKAKSMEHKRIEAAREYELVTNPLTSPLTKLQNGTHIEGYWELYWLDPSQRRYEPGCTKYPMPRVSDTPVPIDFITKFKQVSAHCASKTRFFGGSLCRLCHQSAGADECVLQHFRYPEGLLHYYEVHQVHPSPEFYTFIMNMDDQFRQASLTEKQPTPPSRVATFPFSISVKDVFGTSGAESINQLIGPSHPNGNMFKQVHVSTTTTIEPEKVIKAKPSATECPECGMSYQDVDHRMCMESTKN